jgi:ribosome-associated protein
MQASTEFTTANLRQAFGELLDHPERLRRALHELSYVRPDQSIPLMPHIDFQLDRDHVELNQLLKLVGLCDSGGAGKALVASGAVSVDGRTELRKTCKIRADQVVTVDDIEIRVRRGGDS